MDNETTASVTINLFKTSSCAFCLIRPVKIFPYAGGTRASVVIPPEHLYHMDIIKRTVPCKVLGSASATQDGCLKSDQTDA